NKCLGKMEEVAGEWRTVLFVSHNMQAIRQMCERVILLDQGRIGFVGSPAQAIMQYFGGSQDHSSLIDLAHIPRRGYGNAATLRSIQFLTMEGKPGYHFLSSDRLRTLVTFSLAKSATKLEIGMV